MAVHKGALDAFDSRLASDRKSSDGMPIFVHGLTADLGSGEKRQRPRGDDGRMIETTVESICGALDGQPI